MPAPTINYVATVEDANADPLSIEHFVVWCICFTDDWLWGLRVRERAPKKAMTRIIKTVRSLALKPVYADLSMRQIAQLAQVTEGSIYRLFGDRKRLTACVQRCILRQIVTVTRQLLMDHGASALTLHAVAEEVDLPQDELRFLFPTPELLLDYVTRCHLVGSSE